MVLQLQESSNAIMVPIEIKLERLEQLEEISRRMRAADVPGIPARDRTLSFEEDTAVDDAAAAMFQRLTGGSPQAGLRNGMSFFSNPTGFLMGLMANPIVAAAILGAASAKMILDLLMMHGNVLDIHFKRLITKEDNAARRRHSRQAIRAGLGDQVIITHESGSTSPAYAINTYAARNNGDVDSMKAFQIRKGYKF
jgi:hypothetical protein